MIRPSAPLFLVLGLLLSCGGKSDPADSAGGAGIPVLEPPPAGEGFQLKMTGFTAPPYEEVWVCSVYDAPNTAYAAVNRVEYLQNEGTHHMTLSTVALSGHVLEPGMYDCNDLYGNASLMEDQVMFFGNQGAGEGEMQLPAGTVANLPPNLQVIHEVHYVNPTDQPVELFSYVNGWTIPSDEVTEMIWGGQVRDETISIPAGSEVTEWTRCVMNEDVEVIFLASHTHKLGKRFTIAPFDGSSTGDLIFDNDDWHDPKITQFDPPLVVPAGQGFEYACTWANTTDAEINYGLTADDEMCNMTLVFTPFSTSARCEVVETSDGVLWE